MAGNIKALENSHLLINRGARVGGDIEGDNADVQLLAIGNNARNLVHGSIQIKGAGAVALVCGTDLPQGEIRLEKNTGFVHAGGVTCDGFGEGNTLLNGRIRIKKNIIPTTRSLEITGNVVGGDLEVLKNEGPGPKLVQNNTVSGNLKCFKNDLPFVGGPNTAGSADGQCF